MPVLHPAGEDPGRARLWRLETGNEGLTRKPRPIAGNVAPGRLAGSAFARYAYRRAQTIGVAPGVVFRCANTPIGFSVVIDGAHRTRLRPASVAFFPRVSRNRETTGTRELT